MNCCLTDFSHIRPRHELNQEIILDWIAATHAEAANDDIYHMIKAKLEQLGVGKERIKNRGVHIRDLCEKREIYPVATHPQGVGFKERSQFFDREVLEVLQRFYPEDATLPSHLIHVTCTGYVAPSPAQQLISLKNAGQNTTVTHAYHMGCYAALAAIRIGKGYSGTVDIVHTELCTLHMHPLRHTTEQLIVQSLFADGFIKYRVEPSTPKPHMKVLGLLEEVIPDSRHCMTWSCEDHGLAMTLSKEVPVLITRHLEGYIKRLCPEFDQVRKKALFAVHPGGPKILDYIEQILNLEPFQIQHSKDVLKDYGNMSSATLPHIWERMQKDANIPDKTLIISVAFGPGLSISGGVFEKNEGLNT